MRLGYEGNRVFIAVIVIISITIVLTGCESGNVFGEGPDVIPMIPTVSAAPVDKQAKLVDSGPVYGGTLHIADNKG